MMLRCLLFFTTFVQLQIGFAQNNDIVINEQFKARSLLEVLRVLNRKYDLNLSYDSKALADIRVDASLKDSNVDDALALVLKDTDIYYRFNTTGILLIPRSDRTKKIGAFSGYVIDKTTEETLPFATVALNAELYTITNSQGYFVFPEVQADTLKIKVAYIGYKNQVFEMQKPEKDVRLGIDQEPYVLEGVSVVEALKTIKVGSNAGLANLDAQKVTRLPALGTPDIFRSLHFLPGIAVAEEISSELSVRGGGEDENLVLFDGFKVYHLDHFFGLFSAFNPDAVKNIRIHKGGFGAKFGDAASAVLEITGKAGNRNRLSVQTQIDMINAGIVIESPLGKKASVFASYRGSYAGIYPSALYKNLLNISRTVRIEQEFSGGLADENALVQELKFNEVNTKLTLYPSEKDIFSFSFYSAADASSVTSENAEGEAISGFGISDIAKWNSLGLSGKWSRQVNKTWFTNLLASYSAYESDGNLDVSFSVFQNGSSNVLQEFQQNRIGNANVKLDNEIRIEKSHDITFGAAVEFVNSTLFNDFIEQDVSLTNTGLIFNTYGQDTFRPFDGFELSSGLRYTYFGKIQKHIAAPRLSARYDISEKFRLKAACGKYNQFVRRVPVARFQNKFSWVLADNDRYPLLMARHYMGGFQFKKNSTLLDVELYHKKTDGVLDNAIALNSVLYITDGEYIVGSRTASGIDFFLQHTQGPYEGWVSYSLSRVENTTEQIPQLRATYDDVRDRRHQISIAQMLQLGDWSISTSWIYATGKPYTGERGDSFFNPLNRYINNIRLPTYHRLDISAQYHWKRPIFSGTIGLNFFNVYNRKNIIDRVLNSTLGRDGDMALFETSSLGFFPNFFFRLGL